MLLVPMKEIFRGVEKLHLKKCVVARCKVEDHAIIKTAQLIGLYIRRSASRLKFQRLDLSTLSEASIIPAARMDAVTTNAVGFLGPIIK